MRLRFSGAWGLGGRVIGDQWSVRRVVAPGCVELKGGFGIAVGG